MWEQLLVAIGQNNVAEAERLINLISIYDFNRDYSKLSYTQIPIHYAAQKGMELVVSKLLAVKPDLAGVVDNQRQTALHCAVYYHDYSNYSESVISTLLSVKPDLTKAVDSQGKTAMDYLIQYKTQNQQVNYQIEPLISKISSVDSLHTMLCAIKQGNLTEVKKVIGNVNSSTSLREGFYKHCLAIDYSKLTQDQIPLHLAISCGDTQIINKLFKLFKVKPELISVVNKEGQNALHIASRYNNELILSKLIKMEPNIIDIVDLKGQTVLHVAALYKNQQIVDKLLTIKNDLINVLDKEGNTALHLAVQVNKTVTLTYKAEEIKKIEEKIVSKLLAIKIDLAKVVNKNGQTALHLALEDGDFNFDMKDETAIVVIKLLELSPETANITDAQGRTALQLAILNRELIKNESIILVINRLLEINPKITDITDAQSKTALYYASSKTDQSDNHRSPEHRFKIIDKLLTVKANLVSITNEDRQTVLENFHQVALQYKPPKDDYYNYRQEKRYLDSKFVEITNRLITVECTQKDLAYKLEIEHLKEAWQAKSAQKKISDHTIIKSTEELSYSVEMVSKLLDIQLKSEDFVKTVIDLKPGKLSLEHIKSLLKPVLDNGKTAVIALHLHAESWVSLVIKKQDDSMQLIYNDPRGISFIEEKNVKSLINNIRNLGDEVSVIDLKQTQQITANDSAAFVVDNLINLAKTDTSSMKKLALQKLLAKQDQLNQIKLNHSITEDTNPWYSDIKLAKLLHLKLAGKDQISIAPIVEFERKELLIENVSVAALEVMASNKIAVMPLHLHANHWTALVIKKQNDGSLQILYNDPKGNSLMSEKNSGALLKAISKVNTEFTIIDICLKQQDNDDDCGPYTVENLVKLATRDTSNLHKDQLKILLQINHNTSNEYNEALFIRIQQATELEKAGIPVPVPRCISDKNEKLLDVSSVGVLDEKTLYLDLNIKNADTTDIGFIPPSPEAKDYEVEATGVSNNY